MKRLREKQLEHYVLYEAITNENPNFEMTVEMDDMITKERLEFSESFSLHALTFHSVEVFHVYLSFLTPLEMYFLGVRPH